MQVTRPALPLGGAPPLVVDRTRDLTIEWDGSPSDVQVLVDVQLDAIEGEPRRALRCRYDTALGAARVPSSALSRLSPAGPGFLGVDVVSERVVSVAGWGQVRIELMSSGLWVTGNRFVTSIEVR
ncbi:MAG: hypothetical protein ACFCGT_28625 [Sandaracinaceae bacterium]